jgi:hypothetical protein
MINLQTRLSYIGRISEFVLNREAIFSVWVHRKNGITSVTNFNELYEQLFDDLDMNELERDLPKLEEVDSTTRNRILKFLNVFCRVDKEIEASPSLRDPAALLKSDIWKQFELACRAVLKMPLIQAAMKK